MQFYFAAIDPSNLVMSVIAWGVLIGIVIYLYKDHSRDYLHNHKRFSRDNEDTILNNLRQYYQNLSWLKISQITDEEGRVKVNADKPNKNVAYFFNNGILLKDARRALGFYDEPPRSWINAYKKRRDHHSNSDEEAVVRFLNEYDPSVKFYYVTSNGYDFLWQPFEKAMASSTTKVNQRTRNLYSTFENLAMHLDPENIEHTEWKNLSGVHITKEELEKYGSLDKIPVKDRLIVFKKDGEVIYIDLENMHPRGIQIYPNKDAAKLADTTFPLNDLFDAAYKKEVELNKKTAKLVEHPETAKNSQTKNKDNKEKNQDTETDAKEKPKENKSKKDNILDFKKEKQKEEEKDENANDKNDK